MEFLHAVGPWMVYVAWALLLLLASLLVYVGLLGNFVITALALIYALATGFQAIGWPLLAVLLGIALLGEGIEFVLGNFYVIRKGASARATVGGFVGGLVGAALGNGVVPLVGAIVGSFVGAFAGAVLGEYWHQRHLEPSLRIGAHAFIGRLLAILAKHALGLVMVFLILRATYPA